MKRKRLRISINPTLILRIVLINPVVRDIQLLEIRIDLLFLQIDTFKQLSFRFAKIASRPTLRPLANAKQVVGKRCAKSSELLSSHVSTV